MFCSFKMMWEDFFGLHKNAFFGLLLLVSLVGFPGFSFLSLFNPWTVWIRAWTVRPVGPVKEGNELDLEDYDYEISDDDDEVRTFTLGKGIDRKEGREISDTW